MTRLLGNFMSTTICLDKTHVRLDAANQQAAQGNLLYDRFAAVAARQPDQTALICNTQTLSYSALQQAAAQLSSQLQRQGVTPQAKVGILARRSIDAVIAILAVVRSGATYLPLDPSYPHKMLSQIYQDSAPSCLLAQPELLVDTEIKPFWQHTPIPIRQDAVIESIEAVVPADAESPVYLMYTSGSTGTPKGVLIPHRGVERLVIEPDYVTLNQQSRILHLAPLNFDAATFEIWGVLLNGGTLVIEPAEKPTLDQIGEQLQKHQINTLWLTAGLFHLMVEHRCEQLKPLKQLLAGGDVLSPPQITKLLSQHPYLQLINGYGPTENTTFTCCYRFPAHYQSSGAVPIGKPIKGTQVYLLDQAGEPVAEGETGELCAAGRGVALGYLNRDLLTRERFIRNRFDSAGGLIYRTGDLARQRPDGNFEFLGRVDHQIKLNGKRIELGEIEHQLRKLNGVEDALVLPQQGQQGISHLVALVVPVDDSPSEPLAATLKAQLRQILPDYMVPSEFKLLAAFPLNTNGKIDRQQLSARYCPAPAEASPQTQIAALEGTTFDQIRALFEHLLGRRDIGLTDNFFDLGGTSLKLIELQAQIKQRLGVSLEVVELFRLPSIATLAAQINAANQPALPLVAGSDITTIPTQTINRANHRKAALARARSQRKR